MRIVGVDGGQTGTRCLVVDEGGRVLTCGHGGPSNHVFGERGRRRLRNALESSIRSALPSDGPIPIDSMCLGMTGIGKGQERQDLVEEYVREFLEPQYLLIHNDLVTALAGASVDHPGIMVYAGTGANTYGIDAGGNQITVGGWGHLIDDEGAGYDIGRRALRAVFRAEDGREPPTRLKAKLLEHFGCTSLGMIRQRIYEDDDFTRPEMASLARHVSEAADAGDEIARTILSQAGEILAKMAIVAVQGLKRTHQTVDVYYGGGVFNAGCWILESFADAIHRAAPNARVRPPRFPPVAGTIFLALHPLNIPLSEDFLRHLAKGLKEIGWM